MSTRWCALAATFGALVAGPAAVAVSATGAGNQGAAAKRPCYGAASRDPLRRCVNPALRLTVAPTPAQALRAPNAPCSASDGKRPYSLYPCGFGEARSTAVDNFALVGDSHASHWRGALQHVAVQRHWHGTSLTKTGCPFTTAPLGDVGRSARTCRNFTRHVVQWLDHHPEVHTVFVSGHAGARIASSTGTSSYLTAVTGLMTAMRSMPATVQRVVVLRDVPLRRLRTLECVEHAMAARKPAGTSCAVARHTVLVPDPAAGAARRLGAPRVHLVDLSPFFCSRRLCFPVVGGALVIKDQNHMTTAFSATLGPYVLRRVNAIVPPA